MSTVQTVCVKRYRAALCLVAVVLSTGCGPAPPTGARSPATSTAENSVARRFQEAQPQSQTVVQSAVDLSEKVATLLEEKAALEQVNRELQQANGQLHEKLQKVQQDLDQCQSELNESNQLLMDMLADLNQWKSDILGFRQEMRDASKAQLSALLKILELMGAQVPGSSETPTPPAEPAP